MSAHDVWSELLADGWDAISRWRAEGRPESLFLDFKRAAVEAGRQDDSDDRKNLGKEMSGFSNWEGGVIVWGGETTKRDGADVLHQLRGVGGNLARFEEQMRVRARGATIPPLAGVDVRAFENPARSGDGVVAVYVPYSDGGPYRADGHPDVTGRYYVRTTTDTIVVPHNQLGAMFGRRPLPKLRVGLSRRDESSYQLHVENTGRGAAAAVFVRIRFGRSRGMYFPRGGWQDRTADVQANNEWRLGFALAPGDFLYPFESRVVTSFDLAGGPQAFAIRVDAVDMLPIEVRREANPEPGGAVEWFEPGD